MTTSRLTQSRRYWETRAFELRIESRPWIGGGYTEPRASETFQCISPIDGRRLADICACGPDDIDRAVQVARQAHEAGVWSRQPPSARKRALARLADLVVLHAEELALLETLDTGKPIGLTAGGEMLRIAAVFHWYAEAIDKLDDKITPLPETSLGLLRREPIGVIGAITPWNFPLLLTAWKCAPALAAGNSIVLKPSEKAPLTSIRLASLAAEAGIPEGVFNVVPGLGPVAGKALAEHHDVDMITFTGSTAVGKQLMCSAGNSNMKQLSLECGGKSPNIVFDDAADLETAASASAAAAFHNCGQVCVSPTRLLVAERIADEFVERVVCASAKHAPGDPLDPSATQGALIDETHLRSVLHYIDLGREEGATLRCGGERLDIVPGGTYLGPTVFVDVDPEMTIAREEIFGPVLSVITFRTESEAIRLANDSVYGLHACLWTEDMHRSNRVARRIKAGTVTVNCTGTYDLSLPIGGFKQSGFGKDRSLMALEKYTQVKTTYYEFRSEPDEASQLKA